MARAASTPQATAWVISHHDYPVAVVLTSEADALSVAAGRRLDWIEDRVRESGESARPAATLRAYFHVTEVPVG